MPANEMFAIFMVVAGAMSVVIGYIIGDITDNPAIILLSIFIGIMAMGCSTLFL